MDPCTKGCCMDFGNGVATMETGLCTKGRRSLDGRLKGQGHRMKQKLLGRKRTEVNMTQGSIVALLLNFAAPLLLGNVFQQLYNTVDTWVVGNYVGKNAFSAVGTLNPIINTLIGFFIGFSNGACVIISRHFGAGDKEKVQAAVHTFVTVTLILCVVFTILGITLTPILLDLIKSPAEVRSEQHVYLTIYFAGVTGLLLYNTGSAILRAVGNSVYPFLFLVVSALLNTAMDLIFVIAFGMGTAGVAYATIIAQFVSAVLVMAMLFKTDSSVRIHVRRLRIDRGILGGIFSIGLPAALQMSITAFSNIFVQSYINFFGADCMGGWTAYSKIDQLLFLPMNSLALATQTFVGQNLGKKLTQRTRQGVRTANAMSIICTAVLIVPIVAFAPVFVRFFIDDGEAGVIHYGTLFLRMITPFFLVCSLNQIYGGALRGAGEAKVSMVIMIGTFVVFRQIYLFVVSRYVSNTIIPISMGYPLGWLLCSILMLVSYKLLFRDERLLREKI